MSEEERDEILILNINKWLNDDILPHEFHGLNNWDIYETLHHENISIVQIGSTVYKNHDKSNKKSNDISNFLQDEDEDEDEDDDLKQKLEITKIHQFRIVFDFDDNAKNQTPKVLAIYHLKQEWQQIFKRKEFNDNEIDNICMNEDGLDFMEECDLSLILKSLSKKQLLNGIKSYLKSNSNRNPKLRKIKELKDMNGLMLNDKEFLTLIIAKIIAIDGETILDQFNQFIDNDLDELINTDFKQNMINLKNDINEIHFEQVLDDIEQIVKKVNSLKQNEKSLDLLMDICQSFLIDFIIKNIENENEDLEDLNVTNHSKLNYRIGDLETSIENISNQMNKQNMEKLRDLHKHLMEWKKHLMPIFGPLFSDNIRSLNKKLSKYNNNNKNKNKRTLNDFEADLIAKNPLNPKKKQKTA